MHFRSSLAVLLGTVAFLALPVPENVAHAADIFEEEEKLPDARIRPGRKHVDLQVFGHVNQAFLYADGAPGAERFDIVDNDNSASRFGFRGLYKWRDWFSGVRVEFSAEVNTTDELNFDTDEGLGELASDDDGETDFLSVRHLHWHIGNKRLGEINLGFHPLATQGVSESDLSGTTLIAESDVDDIGGEFQFGIAGVPILGTAFEVDDFFNNLDGERESGVTYRSPKLVVGPGELQLHVSGRVDDEDPGDPDDSVQFLPEASLRYKGSVGDFKFDSAVGYRSEKDVSNANFGDVDGDVVIGSISVLHATGINLTFGGGVQFFDNNTALEVDPDDENFFYGKAGYRADFFEFGETRASVDVFFGEQNEDLPTGLGTELNVVVDAFSVGGGIVQAVPALGAEFYVAARYYEIDYEDPTLDNFGTPAVLVGNLATDPSDLFFFFTGARVRF